MAKSLVIVESPTKARTLGRFLGNDVKVVASMGHVRDLPPSSLGVDVQHEFNPMYVATPNGKKVIQELRRAAVGVKTIYLATDPDREGEAIAWHLYESLRTHTTADFHRVSFHEITRSAVQKAFDQPGELDQNKIDAQQARRVLDRLVGYQVSPLLWKSIQKGTSAGRVQSVALRLVCEREKEIEDFVTEEYWNLIASFRAESGESFQAKLWKLDGEKPVIGNETDANRMADELVRSSFGISGVEQNQKKRYAPPPFITSTLQQAAGSALRVSTSQTMRLAQELYEGVEIGSEGAVGLITYMRTDSVSIAREAQESAREYIGREFGPDYVPAKPNVYRSRKSAQEAHEAIRPTDVNRTPESVETYLSSQQLRLYRLIWNRFVASQMSPADTLEHVVEVGSTTSSMQHSYTFRATATSIVFPGFLKVYNITEETDSAEDDADNAGSVLPELKEGAVCVLNNLERQQKFTEPPRRYSESTLVRELERNGVGRPSTYATIVNTIQQRLYAKKEKGRLHPTPLGRQVNDFLTSSLNDLFRIDFTAQMEEKLDNVEEGEVEWTAMLQEFYRDFVKVIGGEAKSLSAPCAERAARLLEIFTDEVRWNEPVKRGRRVYDDKKFVESLRTQAAEGKAFSDRQWQALLVLAARYNEQLPVLREAASELGIAEAMEALLEHVKKEDAARESAPPQEADPQDLMLLKALDGAKWNPPAKVGKRTYDDKKFYKSLREQVESGKALSDAQKNAARKLLLKYQDHVEGFAEIAKQLGIAVASPDQQAEQQQDLERLIALVGQIKKWDEPSKRGRRTYDDQSFADSICKQYAARKSLSDKQVAALKTVLAKYHARIPDYARIAADLGLPPPPQPPKEVDVKCPKCGSNLVQRTARGRLFYGCSTYPKCRYAVNSLE